MALAFHYALRHDNGNLKVSYTYFNRIAFDWQSVALDVFH